MPLCPRHARTLLAPAAAPALAVAAACAAALAAPALASLQPGQPANQAEPQPDTRNLFHDRHTHQHNPDHPTVAPTPDRFYTTRKSDITLPLTNEQDAFVFAIFGDRTGGPADGVNVLADAVRDVNLLEPDLVLTVGDLIQGYNTTDDWMWQMREYKTIMNELICPWYPVSGNHDIYWRGPNRPANEHEGNYEAHFGPLWYSFTHKNANFIVLHSDEGHPATGEKALGNPDAQVMSDAQKAFLKEALSRGKDLDHQFLFLHHPRWLAGGYGTDWTDNVHQILLDAGNVRAVFAGHIHQMRYDPRDGIDYVTLATTGGGQSEIVPDAGWLHHYHVVTVRKQQVAMAAFPVGEALDPREITGQLHDECGQLARQTPAFTSSIVLGADGSATGSVTVSITNTASRPVEASFTPDSADSRWVFTPSHNHVTIAPGATQSLTFDAIRVPKAIDVALRIPELLIDMDYLAPTFRYDIPTIRAAMPLDLSSIDMPTGAPEMALALNGRQAVRVPSDAASLPDGPMTLECWFNANSFGNRVGLITKTEGSEYGFFLSNAEPYFTTHLGNAYREPKAQGLTLQPNRWYHIAGVYDGTQTTLYLDGVRVASTTDGAGQPRRTNQLPLFIGADVNADGNPTSFFNGRIDNVRLSKVARYTGGNFTPQRELKPDADTVFLYTMDAVLGPYLFDSSPNNFHAETVGSPELVPAN